MRWRITELQLQVNVGFDAVGSNSCNSALSSEAAASVSRTLGDDQLFGTCGLRSRYGDKNTYLILDCLQRPITLLWGAREPGGLYLLAAVNKWKKQWPDFSFIPALSEAPADAMPGAFAGRADQALAAHCPRPQGHVLYCCGSPPMVAAVQGAAMAAGLAAADFDADVFVPGPAAAT